MVGRKVGASRYLCICVDMVRQSKIGSDFFAVCSFSVAFNELRWEVAVCGYVEQYRYRYKGK